jgi:exodeoxyribonuclease VIII
MTLEQLNERPLSYSSIKEFAISPAHYMAYLNRPRKESPELTFGSALHCILLTPESFNDQYIVSKKFDLRKKEDKEEYAKLLLDAEGKQIIQEDMHADLKNLTDLVIAHPDYQKCINNALSIEQKEYVEIYGLPFVRINDIKTNDAIIDIKTVQNASLENLNKDFFNYKYYLQAAVYGGNFKFYVVEKNPPFYNGLMDVSKEWIEYGEEKLMELCMAFNHCLEYPEKFMQSYDFWYEYKNKKPIISLPNWVK